VRALARRSTIRVDLDFDTKRRPAESIEIGVYYVVSEALTNAAKHSRASQISVTVTSDGTVLRATIEDDGIGGAEATTGSGLIGLIDRRTKWTELGMAQLYSAVLIHSTDPTKSNSGNAWAGPPTETLRDACCWCNAVRASTVPVRGASRAASSSGARTCAPPPHARRTRRRVSR